MGPDVLWVVTTAVSSRVQYPQIRPFLQLSHCFQPSSRMSLRLGRGYVDKHLKVKPSPITCSQHCDLQKEVSFCFLFLFLTQTDTSTNLGYSEVIWTGTSHPFSKTAAVISPTRVYDLHSHGENSFLRIASHPTRDQKAVRYRQHNPLPPALLSLAPCPAEKWFTAEYHF